MNKIFLIGNLTADPELRTTATGVSVCTMTIAVNRRFASNREERQTDFFRVSAWRQLGETCSRFLAKGRKVAVVGELSARLYEAKDGSPRVSLEVTAEEVEFLSPREQGQGGYQQGGYQQGGYQQHGGYQQGYNRNYPPQGMQHDHAGNAPVNNGWQDSREASRDEFAGTSFDPNLGEQGFTDTSDEELPF
ncbi:MAG: single-stranded DNA-binding protein [Clostridia bacterium]|nr:single-stranded DNA-binding protein [Clostridia bacterium]